MMSLVTKGCTWRRGPFLDLRIHPLWNTRLLPATQPRSPQSFALQTARVLRRTFAQVAKPTKRPPPPVSHSSVRSQAGESSHYRDSYARILSARRSPTLLYQAPTAWTYPFACVSFGSTVVAYGLYNFYDAFLTPHAGLVWWVPWLHFTVCVFVFGVGALIIRNGTRLVKTINAVPTSAGERKQSVMVRVQMRSLWKWRSEFTVPLKDIQLGDSIVEVKEDSLGDGEGSRFSATEEGRRRAQLAKRKQERERYLDSISNPFRHMASGISRLFRRLLTGIKRAVWREGFANIYMRKKPGGRMSTWRMDVRDGWLLDDGMAAEKLLLI